MKTVAGNLWTATMRIFQSKVELVLKLKTLGSKETLFLWDSSKPIICKQLPNQGIVLH